MTDKKQKDDTIKNALILFIITALAGLLLSFTYNVTKDPIAKQQVIKRNIALNNVLNDASFEEVILDIPENYNMITRVFKAKNPNNDLVGYAFTLTTKEGYGGPIDLIAGLKVDGHISGIDIINHSETPGLGEKADSDSYKTQFVGKELSPLTLVKGDSSDQNIDAIGGATISSQAVINAVNQAIDFYNNEMGGVDCE